MDRCPRCQNPVVNGVASCQNCGYQLNDPQVQDMDQTRLAGQSNQSSPLSKADRGYPHFSPPSAATPPQPVGSGYQAWQQPVYPQSPPAPYNPGSNFYSANPPGLLGDISKDPKKKWYRNKQALLPILIGVVVAIALISGVAYTLSARSKPKPTAAASTQSTQATASEIPTPEVTKVELRADNSWQWQGGAMITKAFNTGGQESPQYSFKVWTPKLKDKTVECTFSPVQNGEKMTDQDISVAATYGEDPAVFVVYTVLTKAMGTSPETVHLYAQELQLPSCKAKPRIYLQTEADNVVNDRQDYSYRIVGKSEKSVAVAKIWSSEYKKPDALVKTVQRHVQVMSLTGGQNKAASLQELAADKDEFAVSSSVTNDIYMIATGKRRFYSIDSNQVLFELPLNIDVGDPSCYKPVGEGTSLNLFRLSNEQYLFSCQTSDDEKHSLPNVFLVDSTGKLTPLIGLFKVATDHPDFKSVTMKQLKDGSVLVTCGASYQVFHLGTDGKVSEILDSAQFERLLHSDDSHFGATNYLTNQFYVQTTDEILAMDLAGKSVKTLDEEPEIVSLATDVTKINWIAWNPAENSSDTGVVLTTGGLPEEEVAAK